MSLRRRSWRGWIWSSPFEAVLETLGRHYAGAAIIMTLGQQGVLFAERERRFRHPVFPVRAVDTTGAGDTFCGYFLAALCRGAGAATALREASAAAAIAVTRAGAVSSIPAYEEVAAFLVGGCAAGCRIGAGINLQCLAAGAACDFRPRAAKQAVCIAPWDIFWRRYYYEFT